MEVKELVLVGAQRFQVTIPEILYAIWNIWCDQSSWKKWNPGSDSSTSVVHVFSTTLFLSLKKSNFLVFFYINQQGEVSKITKGSRVTYTTSGILDVVNDTTLKIRELPINTSIENYENKFKSFMDENDKFIKITD